MKTKIIAMLFFMVFIMNNSFSQKWEKDQPNKLFATDRNGNVNNVKVGIGTSNPTYSLEVLGVSKMDSLVINNGARIYGKLHIGTNSLVLGGTNYPGTSNEMYSNSGALYIQCHSSSLDFNTIFNAIDNTGSVGIGTQFPFAFDNTIKGLEVTGDINITDANNTDNYRNHGYRINGITVLQIQWDNINFISKHNIFVGEQAGKSNTVGGNNTFVGFQSGYLNDGGGNNTFMGRSSGQANTIGNSNVFIGSENGYLNTTGLRNTFIGTMTGNNNNGSRNTFIGYYSGFDITTGNNNTFIGNNTGRNIVTGEKNIFIGHDTKAVGANLAQTGLISNSVVIGSEAIVRSSNKIILGNNIQNIGIGLSDDTYLQGPQKKLEIDAGISGVNKSPSGAAGASGLRFRDLHSGNTVTSGTYNKMLTVNSEGDVILVASSSGGVTLCPTMPDNFLTKKYAGTTELCKSIVYDNGTRIGIGDLFSSTNSPLAALDINTSNITGGQTGEVFRTNCPAGISTYWRMYKDDLEKFRISNPLTSPLGGGSDVVIENTRRGALLFGTAFINRMIILDGPDPNAQTGFVGIGNNFYYPVSQLHINDGLNDTYTQITNNITGALAIDGLRVGILGIDGTAIFNQQENRPIFFKTNSDANNTTKMSLWHSSTNEARVGIGTDNTMPGNVLEINTQGTSTSIQGGSSGLLFQDLTTQTIPVSNPGVGVLSVDNDGNVIYVEDQNGGNIIGGICGQTNSNNYLQNNWEIPLNQNNYIFSGNSNGLQVNNVGIGINSCFPVAKLDILQSSGSIGTIGLNVENKDSPDPNSIIPVIGIKSLVSHSNIIPYYNNAFKVAGWFECSPGWFPVQNPTTGYSNYAIFVPKNKGMVSIGLQYPTIFSNAVSLALSGNSVISGNNIIAMGTSLSDSCLKKDIVKYNNGIEVIRQINPIFYSFNGKANISESLNNVGVIANDLTAFAPYALETVPLQLNITDTFLTNVLGVKTDAILYTVVNAIKDIDSVTTNLSQQIDSIIDKGTSSGDKDWYKVGTTTAPSEINDNKYTYGCIAIGNDSPLNAQAYINNNTSKVAMYVNSEKYGEIYNYGIYSSTMGNIPKSYSIIGAASGGTIENIGVQGRADGNSGKNIGVYGFVSGSLEFNAAIYGDATANPSLPFVNYAGYFNGNIAYTGLINPSDSKLKNNIIPISDALSNVLLLKPKTFTYKTQDFPSMALPFGTQYGLIAQEVETVFPEIVSQNLHPAKFDSLGNTIYDTIVYKGLQYDRLIPILIKAFQEQNDTIDNLKQIIASYESRLSSIENILVQCCSETRNSSVNVTIETRPVIVPVQNTVLNQNQPNPFKTITVFTYVLGENGNCEFVIEDAYGRIIANLVNENQQIGNYSVEWDASAQLPGLYFYSLRVNGKVLVKKAIKIE